MRLTESVTGELAEKFKHLLSFRFGYTTIHRLYHESPGKRLKLIFVPGLDPPRRFGIGDEEIVPSTIGGGETD